MIADAYAAVLLICTDGLKLLMFVNFCIKAKNILHAEGYLPNKSSSFGKGFRKAISNWYFNNDPLKTAEMILKHKSYGGWTHKDIMNVIHIHSENPTHQIFIMHTMCGMKKVEEHFGSKLKYVEIYNQNESYENKQLKFIYNFLNNIHNFDQMDNKKLKKEIELKRWGHMYEVIPQKRLKDFNILIALIKHMPLKILLEKTFYFAKQKLFCNSTPDIGLWEFILRFSNTIELRKSRIHPIEPYIEFVKYSRTSQNILTIQRKNLKKQKKTSIIEIPDDKFVVFMETTKNTNTINNDFSQTTNKTSITSSKEDDNTAQTTVMNKSKKQNSNPNLNIIESKPTTSGPSKSKNDQPLLETKETGKQNQISDSTKKLSLNTNIQQNMIEKTTVGIQSEVNQNKLDSIVLMTPIPKLVTPLITFLSEELIKRTLENLKPSGHRILIVYDSRFYIKKKKCACTHLLNVDEAITLLILSFIYPEKLTNKPTILALKNTDKQCKTELTIDYSQPLTFAYLQSILFEESFDDQENNIDSDIDPLSSMVWAKENNKEYDVFMILGTNKMNLKNVKQFIKEYQAFLKKPVKIVICCLNGKHTEQINLGRGNMLFVVGFDRNIAKVIDSFLNAEF